MKPRAPDLNARARRAILLNDTGVEGHHGCCLVQANLESMLRSSSITIVHRLAVGVDWKLDDRLLTLLAGGSIDLVLVNGEGTLHHDRGTSLLAAARFAKESGAKTVLLNSVWQDNSSEALEIARNFAEIAVRDSRSQKQLAKEGIAAVCLGDASLAFPLSAARGSARYEYGVTDSTVSSLTSHLRAFALEARSTRCFLPVLTPELPVFRFGQRHTLFSFLADALVPSLHDWSRRLLHWRRLHAGLSSYLREVARCRVLVCGRFHAACMALSLQVPVLLLSSNSHKNEALLEDSGLSMNRLITESDLTDLGPASRWSYNQAELTSIREYLADCASSWQEFVAAL